MTAYVPPITAFLKQQFNDCKNAVPDRRVEPIIERKKRISALRKWIHQNRTQIQEALFADLQKPSQEADLTEIFYVLNEIKVALNNLDQWTAVKKVDAPLFLLGTRSFIQYEPLGLCLIISPWNYPFSLAVGPLVSALSAGNCAIIKPSELTPTVSVLIKKMCAEIFDPAIVSVCEGDASVAAFLLTLPFDHIFFTGSPHTGKKVMKAAAENLASITLELGGKCPVIITSSANIKDAASRIAAAKFINNGQTCIAPDYILVDEKIADAFVTNLIEKTQSFFSDNGNFEASANYGRIVNEKHFQRIYDLIQDAVELGAKIEMGGNVNLNLRFIQPVILTKVSVNSRLMNEEIFGPVLPIITFSNVEEAINQVNKNPKPLALYIFTQQRRLQQKVLNETSSGTVCINDCGIQFLHHDLPFGGVNTSGMGKAHGIYGFKVFSNEKSVLKQKNGFTSIQTFYPPYSLKSRKFVDWFLKFF